MDLSNKVENIKFLVTNIENQLPQQIKFDYVFVMDATGREYRMLPDQCSSPQVKRGVFFIRRLNF